MKITDIVYLVYDLPCVLDGDDHEVVTDLNTNGGGASSGGQVAPCVGSDADLKWVGHAASFRVLMRL